MGKVAGLGTVFYKTGNMNAAQRHVARHSFMLAAVSGQLECNKLWVQVGVHGEPMWRLKVSEDTVPGGFGASAS